MGNEEHKEKKKKVSLDWLIGGVLSKIGDTFDRFTGRNWNPSSNLATSKLVEKMKLLLDSEVRDLGKDGKFVPHVFKLKIQWNKFSTDSDEELGKLEHELHAAAIDHINDRLYHTYAPLKISVVKDYFVEGVQFAAGFGEFAEKAEEEREVHITLANIPTGDSEPGQGSETPESPAPMPPSIDSAVLEFEIEGRKFKRELDFGDQRRYGVGRSAANDIVIDHLSISKSHSSIAVTADGRFVVADTGSTNGTFVSGVRIAYGKVAEIKDGARLKFGDVEAKFRTVAARDTVEPAGDGGERQALSEEPAPTVASIPIEDATSAAEISKDDSEI